LRSRPVTVLAAIGAVVVAIVALIELPTVPRFEYTPANYAVAIALLLAVPCLLFWLSWELLAKPNWWRWTLGAVTYLVSIPLFLLASFISLFVVDTSYEPVGALQSEHAAYRVYRTNGGPATSFGIVLRRERPLVPGLKLVTIVRSFDPASDATFERLPSGLFRLTVAPYGQGDDGQVFEFRPDS
jgi:hypothetical protein